MPGRISELGALTGAAAATTDAVEVLDISDTTMAASGTNKKMALSELATFVAANGGGSTGTKLTDYTALTGANAAGTDILEVVDVSDTAMAASGTNKKMTLAELIAYIKLAGGAVPDGDKSEITVSGNTWTIDAGVVTYAKIQNVTTTSRVLGRITAGAGVVEELTAANLSTILGLGALATQAVPATVAQGGTGRITATTAYGLLAAGTTATGAQQTVTPAASGFLKTTSTTALPAWTAISGADLTDGTVSNAKLTQSAALSIMGNNTASPATTADLTVAQVRSMVASGAGALFGFDFDTTTTAGPAVTRLRLNNATPASATIVYVTYTTKDGADLKTRLLAGTAGDRLYIQERANSANWRSYELTGAPTDGTTYATCNVVHRGGAGSLWANSAEVIAGFMTAAITIGTSAPASPSTNDLWVDTT